MKKGKSNIEKIEELELIPIDSILGESSQNEEDLEDKHNNNFKGDGYSGLKLFQFEYEELPKLLDPIFPRVGLASLVGSSDTGKSTFLRQFALSIALGVEDFVGYKIGAKSNNVIFISTEDDPASTSISIKKSVKKLIKDYNKEVSNLNNIKFLFEVETNPQSPNYIINVLEKDLKSIPVDLIVVDAFTDIFSGDINSSTKVREFLNQFSSIAKKYECLVLFLHHTGKKTHKYSASKDNVLGSQAFEAKMRVLLELKHFPHNEKLRTITVTKGNYISSQIKKYSKILIFDEEHLLFSYTGKEMLSTSIASLAYNNPKKQQIMPIVERLHNEKKPIRSITAELKKMGYDIGKSTVANYINEIKSKNSTNKKEVKKESNSNTDSFEQSL